MSFILLGILNSQVEGGAAGAYELIESQVLSSSASSVTFSSIPQDYKHLQIRMVVRSASTSANRSIQYQFNADTGANYAQHSLVANGSVVGSGSGYGLTYISDEFVPEADSPTGIFGAAVAEILDYSNTAKNTTLKTLSGTGVSTQVLWPIGLHSGLWNNTSAVTQIKLTPLGSAAAGSRFSLYGIRG